ncbi:MAG: flagellar filament capping protein FliD, partial [Planctomycetota bacterium]
PIQTLQGRIAQTSSVQIALTSFSTRLNALKNFGTDLRKPSTFEAVTAASTNEQVVGVSASIGAPEGRYAVNVRSLVQTQQSITSGFASRDSVLTAGTLTLEVGDNSLLRETQLSELNDGLGVTPGKFRVTDRAGNATIFDTAQYATLDDLADAINFDLEIDVTADVERGALVLRDQTGGSGTLRVRDLGDGTAAADLGITEETRSSATSSEIVGGGGKSLTVTDGEVVNAARALDITTLNGGSPWPDGPAEELNVELRDGSTFDVFTGSVSTIGDLVDAFNSAAGGRAVMSLNADTGQIVIDDQTTGVGQFEISNANSANVATLLGIDQQLAVGQSTITATNVAFDGAAIRTDLLATKVDALDDPNRAGSALTGGLRGGAGISAGTFTITDRDGNSASIDATTPWLDDILEDINESGIGVNARLNDAGTGIVLEDTTGGTGTLTIADTSGTAAADLNIAGSYVVADGNVVDSGNLQQAFVDETALLATYDLGDDIGTGTIQFTDSAGATADLDLSVGIFEDLGDVIDAVNGLGIGISARLNDNGDGLLIEDTAGGTGPLVIEDSEGTSAEALRIAGSFDAGQADGSFEVKIEVEAGDTLEDVRDKINQLGYGVRAELVSDGDPDNPWRLSLTARDSGTAGAFSFDGGDTGLSARSIVEASDAVVFVGGGDGQPPLTVTSTSNTIENVLPGVTLDLRSTTAGESVEISVVSDQDGLLEDVNGMITAFNALRDEIDENSGYNEETDQRGRLLGEPSVSRAEAVVYGLVSRVYNPGEAQYRILADVGIRLGEGAKLELDEEKFRAALADDPDAVASLFTATDEDGVGTGFGHQLQNAIGELTDPVDGTVTRAGEVLEERVAAFEEQIAAIEEQVLVKEARLQQQFLDMELALGELQFQQQQLSAIPTFQPVQNNNDGN